MRGSVCLNKFSQQKCQTLSIFTSLQQKGVYKKVVLNIKTLQTNLMVVEVYHRFFIIIFYEKM